TATTQAAPPPDTTPPTVSITAPTNGATVSGSVTVTANAADNVAVASVQFLVDGTNLGAAVTTPPYSVTWNTSGLGNNSSHVLKAVAVDTSNNSTTSTAVTVTVTTSVGASKGQWATVATWPLVAVNMALLPNGKIFAYDGQSFGFNGTVWDPAANTFTTVT